MTTIATPWVRLPPGAAVATRGESESSIYRSSGKRRSFLFPYHHSPPFPLKPHHDARNQRSPYRDSGNQGGGCVNQSPEDPPTQVSRLPTSSECPLNANTQTRESSRRRDCRELPCPFIEPTPQLFAVGSGVVRGVEGSDRTRRKPLERGHSDATASPRTFYKDSFLCC